MARRTREAMLVCEAAGYDVVLVETVGVGQSEYAVASMVDFFLVLMLAGAGDELQGIKKGILELADALAINKADGDNVGHATQAAAQYRSALNLFRHATPLWDPPVVTVSALENTGMDAVWSIIEDHRARLSAAGELQRKRREQQQTWFWSMLEDGLKQHFLGRADVKRLLPELESAVASAELTPTEAARRLLALLDTRRRRRRAGGEAAAPCAQRVRQRAWRSRAHAPGEAGDVECVNSLDSLSAIRVIRGNLFLRAPRGVNRRHGSMGGLRNQSRPGG